MLLCNAVATGCALVALIATFAPLTGAHFNPLLTLSEAYNGSRSWNEVVPYGFAQLCGAIAGVIIADAMFGQAIAFSGKARSSPETWLAEIVATFGLLTLIGFSSRRSSHWIPVTVGSYITAAYWFTSSTSFANPVVTIARSLTDSFSGIRPRDVAPFVAAQLVGAVLAAALIVWSKNMKSVLFVCIHNSARSQMAEAFVNGACKGSIKAYSAGLQSGALNPAVVNAMYEIGMDISSNATKRIDDPRISARTYDYVITVCDEASAESCPIVPTNGAREHWGFPDPSTFAGTPEQILEQVRDVRDAIRARVFEWCDGRLRCGRRFPQRIAQREIFAHDHEGHVGQDHLDDDRANDRPNERDEAQGHADEAADDDDNHDHDRDD
jgi:protein-tyrosine-phosphatase/glycerol uptake facilitator-like aquaporin